MLETTEYTMEKRARIIEIVDESQKPPKLLVNSRYHGVHYTQKFATIGIAGELKTNHRSEYQKEYRSVKVSLSGKKC